MSRSYVGLVSLFILQFACAAFFVMDIVMTILGLRAQPISWQTREILEVGAAFGLILGGILGYLALARTREATRQTQESLRVASGAFYEVIFENFATWELTKAEADVALFTIKGLSISEIADLRGTSEGTIKAQLNSIYRKSGTSNRSMLLGYFVEHLLDNEPVKS